MDPASLAGGLLALAAVIGAMFIEGGNPTSLLLPGPLLLVFVGTLGAGLASGLLKDAISAFSALPKALTAKTPNPEGTIETIVSLADKARREGLLALEDRARDVDDEFLRAGLQSAIDGTDPDDLRIILEDRIATKRAADRVPAGFFSAMGGYAPTIGIIGTVVSLVHVLENLSEPSELGPLIASAFVATLWGIASANIMWLPLGARLKRISEAEITQMEITLEGLLALQSGANPRLVGERLRAMVPAGKPDKDKG